MRATGWLRRNPLEAGWAVFAAANWAGMVVWPSWETIPFHFVWISLTIVYGFRVWSSNVTSAILGVVGAILAVRGLFLHTTDPGVVQSPLAGLGFVWTPKLSGLKNPSTWLAAAGQIFFTLSVGMGSIHCYASYLGKNQDIALNAASAGWMGRAAASGPWNTPGSIPTGRWMSGSPPPPFTKAASTWPRRI